MTSIGTYSVEKRNFEKKNLSTCFRKKKKLNEISIKSARHALKLLRLLRDWIRRDWDWVDSLEKFLWLRFLFECRLFHVPPSKDAYEKNVRKYMLIQ